MQRGLVDHRGGTEHEADVKHSTDIVAVGECAGSDGCRMSARCGQKVRGINGHGACAYWMRGLVEVSQLLYVELARAEVEGRHSILLVRMIEEEPENPLYSRHCA